MYALAFIISGLGAFILGGLTVRALTRLTEDDTRVLDRTRQRNRLLENSNLLLRNRVSTYRLEIYKLNKSLRRRTRQLHHLKSRMERAGVPAHTPGTRPQIAQPGIDPALLAKFSPASSSTDTGSRMPQFPAESATDPVSRILD